MNTLLLAAPAGGNSFIMIIAFVVLFGFMYFTMIRPQKKQNEARMKMISELKKGDHVILIDGMHGKIDSIDPENKTVVIDADGIYLTFSRIAIRKIVPAEEQTKKVEAKPETASVKNEKPAEADKPAPKLAPSEEKPKQADDEAKKDE